MSGRGLRIVTTVVGVLALALPLPASAHGTAKRADTKAERLAQGLVYRGLVRAPAAHPCAGGFLVPAHGAKDPCTHGPDPAPSGRDVRRRRSLAELRLDTRRQAVESTAATAAAVAGGAVTCIGDGSSGNRVQAVYAYPAGSPDRTADVTPLIRSYASAVDAVFAESAAETDGERFVRWVTDEACELDIETVEISLSARDEFGTMVGELAALGFDDPARKYLVWVDANVYCGIASLYLDDRKAADNWNNGHPGVGGMVARVDNGCWNYAETHELVHNLGGVQDTAPHATGYGHCTDESDDMCYSDAPGVAMQQVCPLAHEALLDCNHDDYFHTSPPAGNYLATHWNTAESSFLSAALLDPDPPVVAAPRVSFRASVGRAAVPTTVSWSATDAGGVAGYALFESVDGGAYAELPLVTPTAVSAVRSLRPGRTYRFRVEAVDDSGNTGSAEGESFAVAAYQEKSGAITYRDSWARRYSRSALAYHQRSSGERDARARLSFTGFAVAWVARTGPMSGRARVYVDGRYVRTVDLWDWNARARRVVYSRRFATNGPHTLAVVVRGTRGRPRVDVDAFVVLR